MAQLISIFTFSFMSLMRHTSLADGYYGDRCGNVLLPYPFFISTSFDKDDSFAVTCSNSSSHGKPTPILTKLNLELIDVQQLNWVSGQITVNIPTAGASVCGGGLSSWSSLDLSGTLYSFSAEQNVFVSLGCGSGYASFDTKASGKRVANRGGCSSTCEPEGQVIDGCSGYYCCQADTHSFSGKDFKRYIVRVNSSSSSSCRSAFLTSRTFLITNTTIATAKLDSVATIPVVLTWTNYSGPGVISLTYATIIVIALATLLVSCCVGWSCWLWVTKKRRKEIRLRAKYFKRRLDEEWCSNIELAEKTKLFSMKEMKKATNNFNKDRILGQGGQGTVYKGMITEGQVIAVKKSRAFDERDWKQFINEVILLSKFNHRNVVKLLGCCLEAKPPMLVYEFIPKGTLSQHIRNSEGEILITWEMRVRIASEVAGAIAYLHSSSSNPIYHRDIKSTNILLDEKFQAKVADFGIAKAISVDQTHLTTRVQGTFGYLDPEYFITSQFSEKSDVYSFGVVLVELLTGQRPIRDTIIEDKRSLVDYFISSMDDNMLDEILDPIVLSGSTKEEVVLVANLARRCLKPTGVERPTMNEVAMDLEGLRRKKSSTAVICQEASLDIECASLRFTDMEDTAFTSPAMLQHMKQRGDLDAQHELYFASHD